MSKVLSGLSPLTENIYDRRSVVPRMVSFSVNSARVVLPNTEGLVARMTYQNSKLIKTLDYALESILRHIHRSEVQNFKGGRKGNSRPMISHSCQLDISQLYSNCINLPAMREAQTSTELLIIIRKALY